MPLLAGLMIVLLRAIFPAEADIRRAWSQSAWCSNTAFLTLRTFLTRRTKLLFLRAPAGGVGMGGECVGSLKRIKLSF